MLDSLYSRFASVWCWDTEFVPVPGWRVTPVCLAATEARSGISKTLWLDHPGQRAENPLPFGPDALHIVYNAGAELGFALAMGWVLPCNILDLWVERRNFTNNMVTPTGEFIHTGLIETCHAYGVFDTTAEEVKESMQERISAGYPYTNEEAQKIQEYCMGDVRMLLALAHKMVPQIENLDQALHRGRCMRGQARIEWNGVPCDVEKLDQLNRNMGAIRHGVVHAFQDEHKLELYWYDKKNEPHFDNDAATAWVRGMGFTEKRWPSTSVGPYMDADFLEEIAAQHPQFPAIESLRQLRKFLAIAKKKFKFSVGPDARNRTSTKPFVGRASRSQPETKFNIANSTKALRSLMKPSSDREVLMHRDWSNAEYGIAAALSGDDKRWYNYQFRDAYLTKAADFGFCPYDATKETHREIRNQFKSVVLAGQYGQTPEGLALVLSISVGQAKIYQEKEAKLYPAYQRWLRANEEDMAFELRVQTEFGWNLWMPKRPTGHDLRTAMNLPMQGNCGEIMRLTVCYATEAGIDVGATIHDAFMYTAPADCWQDVDAAMKKYMDMACQDVIGEQYVLKSDRHVVFYPERYRDEDGQPMWNKIEATLAHVDSAAVLTF